MGLSGVDNPVVYYRDGIDWSAVLYQKKYFNFDLEQVVRA